MDDDIKDNCNYFLNKPLPNVDGSEMVTFVQLAYS